MSKTALSKLLDEKRRFTVETQGLSYAAKQGPADPDAVWDSDSDHSSPRRKGKSPLMAQRVAAKLVDLLQHKSLRGFSGPVSEQDVDQLLAATLEQNSGGPEYELAKDYLKQVLQQLYGNASGHEAQAASAGALGSQRMPAHANVGPVPGESSGTDRPTSNLPSAAEATALLNGHGEQPLHLDPAAADRDPGLDEPDMPVPRTAARAPSPLLLAAMERESAARTYGMLGVPYGSGAGGNQAFSMLRDTDQLAAIISVATTAATTAATAAVKNSMTPPLEQQLGLGGLARMRAAAAASGPYGQYGGYGFGLPGQLGYGMLRRQGGSPDSEVAPRAVGPAAPHPRQVQGLPRPMLTRPDPGNDRAPLTPSAQLEAMQQGLSGQGGSTPSSNVRVVRLGAPRITTRPSPAGEAFQVIPPAKQRLGPGRHTFQHAGRLDADGEAVLQHVPPEDTGDADTTGAGADDRPAAARSAQTYGLRQAMQRGNSAAEMTIGVQPDRPGSDGPRSPPSPGPQYASNTEHDDGKARAPWSPRIGGRGLEQAHAHAAHAANVSQQAVQQLGAAARLLLAKASPRRDTGADVRSPPAAPQPGAPQLLSAAAAAEAVAAFASGRPLPAEGVFAASGIPAVSLADALAIMPGKAGLGPAVAATRRLRAPLPEDMADTFRHTLAFLANPDEARQVQPPAWQAMADVDDREQAEKEVQQLLGGAFDYNTAKQQLAQGKRRARGLLPHVPGSSLATGAAAPPRPDIGEVLAPAQAAWEVEEAWHDLDAYSKVIEQEVAHRAAMALVNKKMLPDAATKGAATTSPGRGAPSERLLAAKLGRPRQQAAEQQAAAAAAAAASDAAAKGRQEVRRSKVRSPARDAGGAANSRPAAASSSHAAVPESQSPDAAPRPAASTRQRDQGPVRIAFGRRVDAPMSAGAAAARSGDRRTHSSSPPARRSPQKAKSRRRAVQASPGAPTTSTGLDMHEVLSALASVLQSESEGEGEQDGPAIQQPALQHAPVRAPPQPVDAHAGTTAAVGGAAPQDETGAAPAPATHADVAAAEAAFGAPTLEAFDAMGAPPAAEASAPGLGAPEQSVPGEVPVPAPVGMQAVPAQAAPASYLSGPPAAGVLLGATATAAQRGGRQPWPRTVGTVSPKFAYVVDTAHPPVARLPAWAASAGRSAAAAANLAAWPSTTADAQLPSTPTRSQPAAVSNQQPAHFDAMRSQAPATATTAMGASAMHPQARRGAATGAFGFGLPHLGLTETTQILPPAGLRLAEAGSAGAAPQSLPQLERAVMQLIEDEVFERVAVAELAAMPGSKAVAPDAPGLPLLMDLGLSQQLVREVLKEQLQQLMAAHEAPPSFAFPAQVPQSDMELIAAIMGGIDATAAFQGQQAAPVQPLLQQPTFTFVPEEQAPSMPPSLQPAAPAAQPPLAAGEQAWPSPSRQSSSFFAATAEAAFAAAAEDVAPPGAAPFSALVHVTEGLHDGDQFPSLVTIVQHEGPLHLPTRPQLGSDARPPTVLDEQARAVSLEAEPSGSDSAAGAGVRHAGSVRSRLSRQTSLGSQLQAEQEPQAAAESGVAALMAASAVEASTQATVQPYLFKHAAGSSAAEAIAAAVMSAAAAVETAAQSWMRRSAEASMTLAPARGRLAAPPDAGRDSGSAVFSLEGSEGSLDVPTPRAQQGAAVREAGVQAMGPDVPQYLLQGAMLRPGMALPYHVPVPVPIPTTYPTPILPLPGSATGPPELQPHMQPYFLLPSDMVAALGAGGAVDQVMAPYAPHGRGRSDAPRPKLNLPGVSKMRDSSEVDSSTDTVHLLPPGARARASGMPVAASIDSDEDLLARSYAALELTDLTARPLQLQRHRPAPPAATDVHASHASFGPAGLPRPSPSPARGTVMRADSLGTYSSDNSGGVVSVGAASSEPAAGGDGSVFYSGAPSRLSSFGPSQAGSVAAPAAAAAQQQPSQQAAPSGPPSVLAQGQALTEQPAGSSAGGRGSSEGQQTAGLPLLGSSVAAASASAARLSALATALVEEVRQSDPGAVPQLQQRRSEGGSVAGTAAPDEPVAQSARSSEGGVSRVRASHAGGSLPEPDAAGVNAAGDAAAAADDDEYVDFEEDEIDLGVSDEDLDEHEVGHVLMMEDSEPSEVSLSVSNSTGNGTPAALAAGGGPGDADISGNDDATSQRAVQEANDPREEAEQLGERTASALSRQGSAQSQRVSASGTLARQESRASTRSHHSTLGRLSEEEEEGAEMEEAAAEELLAAADEEVLDQALELEEDQAAEDGAGRNSGRLRQEPSVSTASQQHRLGLIAGGGSSRRLLHGDSSAGPRGEDAEAVAAEHVSAGGGPSRSSSIGQGLGQPQLHAEPSADHTGLHASGLPPGAPLSHADSLATAHSMSSAGGLGGTSSEGASDALGLKRAAAGAARVPPFSGTRIVGSSEASQGAVGGRPSGSTAGSVGWGIEHQEHPETSQPSAGGLTPPLERMARVGLASLELPHGALKGAAVVHTAVPPLRPVLAPLQQSGLQAVPPAQPASPGKPPSLDDYQGPTGRLWRPALQPAAGGMRGATGYLPDVGSSSETLMASSEASTPPPDPLSKATAARRAEMEAATAAAGPGGRGFPRMAAALAASGYDPATQTTSGRAARLAPVFAEPGLEPSASAGLGGRVSRLAAAFAATSSIESSSVLTGSLSESRDVTESRHLYESRQLSESREGGPAESSVGASSLTTSFDSGVSSGIAGIMRPGGGRLAGADAAAAAAAALGGAGRGAALGRPDRTAALSRLKQYGARRRKLMQQIGIKDPLMASTSSLTEEDTSTGSEGEDEEGFGASIAGRGAGPTRLLAPLGYPQRR